VQRWESLQERARARGVSSFAYWPVRLSFQPAFHLYFGMRRQGREHIPADGPVIFASNHRSFLDPFLIACLVRRPVHYVAKRELFANPVVAWVLSALGAFPIDRGRGDEAAMATARAILARGDCVVIFPEGTRVRPGPLGHPRRGVGRLALQTGAPVVPVAVIGSEDVRRGVVFRPRRVTLRCEEALRLLRSDDPSPEMAEVATSRIWAGVQRAWEGLGGATAPSGTPTAEEPPVTTGAKAA
jgi:glycerol-3-phosphate dehydrogenase (NAD(P)+)